MGRRNTAYTHIDKYQPQTPTGYHGGICGERTNGRATGRHGLAANLVKRLNVQAQHIKCDVCGSYATRLEIEIVGTAETPSEIVDLIAWIQCPKCGPRKQPAPPDVGQKATIEYIRPMPTPNSPL